MRSGCRSRRRSSWSRPCVDLSAAIAWPATPDLSASVTARLAAWRPAVDRPEVAPKPAAGPAPGRRPHAARGRGGNWHPIRPRPSVHRVRARAIAVSDDLASPSREAAPPGASIGLGDATTLESVLTEAEFPVVVPAALGPPDAVYLGGPRSPWTGGTRLRGQGRPACERAARWRGAAPDAEPGRRRLGLADKIVDSGFGTVQRVDVGDDAGYWFAGAPHWFWYLAPDGQVIEESRRVVGNTLAWQRGDILFRIEGAISLERALEIADSLPVAERTVRAGRCRRAPSAPRTSRGCWRRRSPAPTGQWSGCAADKPTCPCSSSR